MTFRRFATPLLLGACLQATTALAQHEGHRIVTPEDLKWENAASLPPGAKVAMIDGRINQEGPIIFRVKLPANYRIPPHFHGTHERVTVISGTLNIGIGDKFDTQKTTLMKPGTVNLMPPKMHHFAWTTEEVVFQLNVMGPWTVTYLNPADDPRNK